MDALREITRAPLRTVRPKQLAYPNPNNQLARLLERGRVVRIAPGFYTAVPDDVIEGWFPPPEEAAIAVATAMHGDRVPVLMGLSAARIHHAIPRRIGVAIVAVPHKRNPVILSDGTRVLFVQRDVTRVQARLETLRIGAALVTNYAQTAYDLLMRPQLGGMSQEAEAAVQNLEPRVDGAAWRTVRENWVRANDAVRDFDRELAAP